MKVLVLNAGSSSQKSCLYELKDPLPQQAPAPLWKASIDWTAKQEAGELTVKARGKTQEIELDPNDRQGAIALMLNTLVKGETQVLEGFSQIEAVGHRIVHGGAKYTKATLITPEVKEAIAELIPLAPNHNPAHLEGIEAVEQILQNVPQYAVFDTAFHRTMPMEASMYPIPYEWFEKGIHRYGFHGISHKYCAGRTAQILNRPLDSLRIITCHLGNGCSLAAIKNGISINTTMGFTPLEGVMMGTRSGSIDPAIVLYLMREHNYTADKVDKMLNKESGLKGICGESDMRTVERLIESGSDRARLAFDLYNYRLQAAIGSLLPALGGLGALVFTAGVGEHQAQLRERTCVALGFLGVTLDREKNNASPQDEDIATPDSTVRVLVVATEEDWAIAQECWYQRQ